MTDALDRFRRALDRLGGVGPLGVAVSGGPDSLALLVLAAAARPGGVFAATVDHQLRADSRTEAEQVAAACARLDVPHSILPITVAPGASLQAEARKARYAALAQWAAEQGVAAVLTAHHADDQAETLLMRLARGAGANGLAGIRRSTVIAGTPVLRPLLDWRKDELRAIVAEAGLSAVDDPANSDLRHHRTHARGLLQAADWLDPSRLAASAAWLADAEEALVFATDRLAGERLMLDDAIARLRAGDLPGELQRRLLLRAMAHFGPDEPRGPDLQRALDKLGQGGSCTLAGLRLTGGPEWRIEPEPPRRQVRVSRR